MNYSVCLRRRRNEKFPPSNFKEDLKVNIEDLKKRKGLLENNLKNLNERIRSDTENSLRIHGAIIDVLEIIKEDEDKQKEEDKTKKKNK